MELSSSLAAVLHSPLFHLAALVLVPVFTLLSFSSAKRPPPSSSGDGGGRRLPLPPSPRGVPFLGHLPLLGSLPHRKLRSMAEAHGPVMLLWFGRVPTVVASSAAAAQEAMRTRDLAFASRARDMIAAATDTSFTTLERAMAELINHPPVMRKLQGEIRAAVGVPGAGGEVTEDHLGELRFLRAVIKETLRLHAPVPLLVPRETVEDTELLGYRVPARTRVVINAWAIGRDAAAWGDRAEEFVPERWLEDGGGGGAEYAVQLGQDFRFVPFGAGRRGCPGAGFAAPSVELALASLLYHFDWELPHPAAGAGGTATSKLDMGELYGLSMCLKAALNLVAKPWSHLSVLGGV